MSELEGLRVNLSVSDPWDFGTIHGTGPFSAQVLKECSPEGQRACAILIKLDKPLKYKDLRCEYFVASPRLERDSLDNIQQGVSVGCGLTCISEEHAKSPDPFDLSWWRGGVGLIADLSIAKKAK